MSQFLELEFTDLTLNHQELFEFFFSKYPQKISKYTFASCFAWGGCYRYAWTRLDENTLLIRVYIESLDQYHLLQPIGEFSEAVQKSLLKGISAHEEYPIKIFAVSEEFLRANADFVSNFDYYSERNYGNYLYQASDLASLAGRKYEKKRNLISQVDRAFNWAVEPLKALCTECPRILNELGIKDPSEMTHGLENELHALDKVLTDYDQLHLKGSLIRIDDRPVAFSAYQSANFKSYP